MEEHLSNEELTLAIVDKSANQTRGHLERCAACRAEVERLSSAVSSFALWAHQAAERPNGFWQAQASAIRPRLREPRSLLRRLAWAGALALLLLAATLLSENAPPAPTVAQTDPDHALLVDVEHSVRRELPRALEPAALLAEEVSRASEPQTNP